MQAVIVGVADESRPNFGDLIIMQTDVFAGDGTARESTEDHHVGIPPILFIDHFDYLHAIVDGRLDLIRWFISPPGIHIPGAGAIEMRHAKPNESFIQSSSA
jgi:hypothetical protein